MVNDLRTTGREAFRGRAWRRAADSLRAADAAEHLGPVDLTMLAEAAFLSGDVDGCVQAYERAFRGYAVTGEPRAAARVALWLGQTWATRGAMAAAGGWLGRAAQILDQHDEPDCVERGYLLMPVARAHFEARRYADTLQVARTAEDIGRRHDDGDLVAFARHSQGRALLRLQQLDEGLDLFDRVFVEVLPAGLTAPILTGMVVCSVVQGCQQVGAFDRAAEWTAAFSAWCDEQPQLVPFSSECLLHRAEVLLRRGDWHRSLAEARSAAWCADRDGVSAMAAAAAYQQGEALRLLGREEEAELAYRTAQQGGHDPLPGLALLHLQQHRGPVAAAALRRALAATDDPLARARLLPAFVDVLLASGDHGPAAVAASELTELASRWPAVGLRAAATHANGAVALAAGDPPAAIKALQDAWHCWRSVQAPYEAAQARILLGRACAALGDEDAAVAHEKAAAAALHDIAGSTPGADGRIGDFGLSPRETEVLELVAAGLTNRAVAARLVLSERTIDRHVSNILGKLGVPTRTAATALALRHGTAGTWVEPPSRPLPGNG
jgi:DNA-binding CsgD family transcriptional regulator